jgi:hypothetical protein
LSDRVLKNIVNVVLRTFCSFVAEIQYGDLAIEMFCKGSFGSHHLGLELKNLFMILTITYLAATKLVVEFI